MKQHWKERFRLWVCSNFGHRALDKENSWVHDEHTHTVCKYCRRIESVKEK